MIVQKDILDYLYKQNLLQSCTNPVITEITHDALNDNIDVTILVDRVDLVTNNTISSYVYFSINFFDITQFIKDEYSDGVDDPSDSKIINDLGEELDPNTLIPKKDFVDFYKIKL